jgi:molybdopterin molybdotransferase
LVPDDLAGTREALKVAFRNAEVVVSSGGVSVGEYDFVKAAFEALGGRLDAWRVAMRPGKPFAFGRWEGKCLFGLPGNPVSAFVTFLILVRPALLRLQGASETDLPVCEGVLGESLSNAGDRRHFVRVRIDDGGRVVQSGLQASHRLESLAGATGLVDLAPGSSLRAGERVRVLQIDR